MIYLLLRNKKHQEKSLFLILKVYGPLDISRKKWKD